MDIIRTAFQICEFLCETIYKVVRDTFRLYVFSPLYTLSKVVISHGRGDRSSCRCTCL